MYVSDLAGMIQRAGAGAGEENNVSELREQGGHNGIMETEQDVPLAVTMQSTGLKIPSMKPSDACAQPELE